MPKPKSAEKPKAKYPPPIPPAKWAKMTPRQRLLAIAKDVLAQLASRKKERLRPQQMVYVNTTERLSDLSAEEARNRLLDGIDCAACAVGAMWLSRIRLADAVEGWKVAHHYPLVRKDVGSRASYEIESAFEQDRMGTGTRAAVAFGARYIDPTVRLKAIMKNVVAHSGRFVPGGPARKPKAAR